IDAHWWTSFGDPNLTELVETALARNTNVLVAAARVEEARAAAGLAHAARLPTVDAAFGASESRALSAATGAPTTTTALQPQLQAAWDADLFGRLGKLDQAARLTYVASQAERDAVALAVAAATARSYIALLSLDAQLAATRATVA